ncbi:MAG: biotin/lipoyl attachment protein [Candidatus Krumholzibacteriota bacterium]|nr:biotin/lipoyl attachment protein [Candidatus Krumholzibacteriota bacterium]
MVSKFRLVLEGVPYEIERKGDLLLVNGQEYPCSVKGNAVTVSGNAHTVQVQGGSASVDGIAYTIEAHGLEEPKAAKTRKTAAADRDDAGVITAVMPGLVIKINKKAGDRVAVGEVVMILEAMKMQNELQAKQAGVVKQINVKQGESVEMRQVLAVIE